MCERKLRLHHGACERSKVPLSAQPESEQVLASARRMLFSSSQQTRRSRSGSITPRHAAKHKATITSAWTVIRISLDDIHTRPCARRSEAQTLAVGSGVAAFLKPAGRRSEAHRQFVDAKFGEFVPSFVGAMFGLKCMASSPEAYYTARTHY